MPWIQLKGKWLAKAGFNIDTPIKIEVNDGKLVLTAE
ncbi:SymE family type I addiction module toxin [Microbulbifer sp. SSSA007]